MTTQPSRWEQLTRSRIELAREEQRKAQRAVHYWTRRVKALEEEYAQAPGGHAMKERRRVYRGN